MIHIFMVHMDGDYHFIVGDDETAIREKVDTWKTMGGKVISRISVEGSLGMVITRRVEDREHISQIEDTRQVNRTTRRWG